MTLDEIFKHGQDAAAHLFNEQGMLHPMWIAETESGQLFPVVMQMPDRDARDAITRELRETFKRNRVVRYVGMVEAWALEVNKESAIIQGYSGSLKDHEDRREVIFVSAEDKDGSERSGQFYILRPEQGKAKLSSFKLHDGSKNEGRFTHLLKAEE